MTDLTSKSAAEAQILLQKYAPILEPARIKNLADAQIFVIAIDVAINYLEEAHKELSADWKAWTTVVVKKFFKKLNTEEEVKALVDDFVQYYKSEYQNYIGEVNGIGYDLECGFVHKYMVKKNR